MEVAPPSRSAPDAPTEAGGSAGPGASGRDLSARAGDDGFLLLSPKVKVLWRLGHAVTWSVLLAIVVVIGVVATDVPAAIRFGIALAVAVIGLAVTMLVPDAQYRRWGYLVTAEGIELRHGLLVRNRSSIPHFRVQHVDLRQGVLQRWLGIVSVSISTASPASDAALPGVDPAQAERVRRQVIDRTEAHDGV